MPKHCKQEKLQVSTSEELKSKSPERKIGRLYPVYLKKNILQEQAELSTGKQGWLDFLKINKFNLLIHSYRKNTIFIILMNEERILIRFPLQFIILRNHVCNFYFQCSFASSLILSSTLQLKYSSYRQHIRFFFNFKIQFDNFCVLSGPLFHFHVMYLLAQLGLSPSYCYLISKSVDNFFSFIFFSLSAFFWIDLCLFNFQITFLSALKCIFWQWLPSTFQYASCSVTVDLRLICFQNNAGANFVTHLPSLTLLVVSYILLSVLFSILFICRHN